MIKITILTTREEEIFKLLVKNHTTKEIALKLNISEKTCRNHVSNVIGKLGVTSRTQAILELVRMKILTIE